MTTINKTNNSSASSSPSISVTCGILAISSYVLYKIIYWSYKIRMQAIEEYGLVIHEFDPYFNYRATEYLYAHGMKKFFTWFDYMVWYPLGRPVGSTIYPGMQFTAVYLKEFLLTHMSINDICCMIPSWFGAIATVVTGLLAYECTLPENSSLNPYDMLVDFLQHRRPSQPVRASGSSVLNVGGVTICTSPALECALVTMGIMSIIPAHLMRSVGGGYDNESVAMTAMTVTFYCWVRALRGHNSFLTTVVWGVASGLAYFYMVAAWGGYIFVLNMVGVHALLLVLMGRFTDQIYTAYSLFYLIGTFLAVQIPVVGWAPLKSLEQLGPCLIFLGYQGLQLTEVIRKQKNFSRAQSWKLRLLVASVGLLLLVVTVTIVAPSGYFGPLSSRVRGLFVRHTKTGNPLVDSVAEHQPASNKAYFQYLHHICLLAPVGYATIFFHLGDASSFLLGWGAATYFFSSKMVRLVLLLAPIGSICGGIAAGRLLRWCIIQLWDAAAKSEDDDASTTTTKKKAGGVQKTKAKKIVAKPTKTKKGGGKGSKNNLKKQAEQEEEDDDDIFESAELLSDKNKYYNPNNPLTPARKAIDTLLSSNEGIMLKRTFAVLLLLLGYVTAHSFKDYSWRLSKELSHPSIIVPARTRQGQVIKVDDYRQAYWWLRDNTPQDSRILAWWDYGYQIAGIANRTTIADGNTWNHEHIALLGKCLTTDLQGGYEIARHLADYVLIWAGGGGDDLAKSPHLARIANSVYRDHCPQGDPTCRAFGFVDRQGTASPMMQRSLLYQLHGHQIRPDVSVSEELFTLAYQSKYGKVRIYKIQNVDRNSKEWVQRPENRVCDVPGSWFCPGQYPPGLSTILGGKQDFAQLEDFNKGTNDEQYQKDYFDALNDPHKARNQALQRERAAARLKEKQDNEQRKRTLNKIKTTDMEQQEANNKPRRRSSSSGGEAASNSNNNNKQEDVVINPDGSVSSSAINTPSDNQDDDASHIPTSTDPSSIEAVYNSWRDTEQTTALWTLISSNHVEELTEWFSIEPLVAFSRSQDGRGPMWWAYEMKRQEIIAVLKEMGVPEQDVDANGNTPASLVK